MHQCINEQTRINNILDLFLTNNPDIVCQVTVLDTVVSDHKLILVGTYIMHNGQKVPEYSETSGFSKLNFNHNMIEWEKLSDELAEIDWIVQLDGKCTSEMLQIITDILLIIVIKISLSCPRKGTRRKKVHHS